MFTTGHLASGVAVGLAFGLDGIPLALFVGAAVLTDWDYSIQLLTGVNHRKRLTHSPPVVLGALAALTLVHPHFAYLLAGSALHLALDPFDYALRLNPFSKRMYGFRWLTCGPDAPFLVYVREYFTDPRFVAMEAFLALAAIGALVWRTV